MAVACSRLDTSKLLCCSIILMKAYKFDGFAQRWYDEPTNNQQLSYLWKIAIGSTINYEKWPYTSITPLMSLYWN